VLEGLYHGACAALPEQIRAICPEATVSGLAGNGKYSLIRMVRVLPYSRFETSVRSRYAQLKRVLEQSYRQCHS
jgi:hypothetical protein